MKTQLLITLLAVIGHSVVGIAALPQGAKVIDQSDAGTLFEITGQEALALVEQLTAAGRNTKDACRDPDPGRDHSSVAGPICRFIELPDGTIIPFRIFKR